MLGMNLGVWNRGQVIDPSWWVPKDARTLDLDALNWRAAVDETGWAPKDGRTLDIDLFNWRAAEMQP